MKIETVTLKGNDLGVMIGYVDGAKIGGIFLYKPENNFVPFEGMTQTDYGMCLPPGTKFANIPYEAVKKVDVGGSTVWMNRDYFSEVPKKQNYRGRGDVEIELAPIESIDQLVDEIVQRDAGLQKALHS